MAVEQHLLTTLPMRIVQGAFDLVCIGVGLMLGAGVFITTGDVAVNNSG